MLCSKASVPLSLTTSLTTSLCVVVLSAGWRQGQPPLSLVLATVIFLLARVALLRRPIGALAFLVFVISGGHIRAFGKPVLLRE